MSLYTDAWSKAAPETPAGFLLRMAGYEVTLLAREKAEQDAQYRYTVATAALDQVGSVADREDFVQANADLDAIQAAWDALKGSWTQVSKKDATI